jgi:hypothetical protein
LRRAFFIGGFPGGVIALAAARAALAIGADAADTARVRRRADAAAL